MGSLIIKDVPADTVAFGSPAKVVYSREDYDNKMKNWVRTSK